MYLEHFALKEMPFTLAPDPRYLYMSEGHREALAHLLYGIKSNGCFVLLTGEVGTGKTTLCRCLLDQVPDDVEIAFILNPRLTVQELLAVICDELGIRYRKGTRSTKVLVDHIYAYLLDAYSKGRKTVLVIEEAQNLSPDVLEQIRLLTNLETEKEKLLQIILIGQPELREMLSRAEFRQISQRITARYHLGPLSEEDVPAYISHRLSVAGARSRLFPPSTFGTIYRLTGGVPRLVNLLCDRALLGAYAEGRDRVEMSTLMKAAQEVFGLERPGRSPFLAAAAVVLMIAAVLSALYLSQRWSSSPPDHRTAPQEEGVAEAGLERSATLSWPGAREASSSRETAYQALFKEWGALFDPGLEGTACQQAAAQGLGCLHKRGDFSTLRQLNRPAVMRMRAPDGSEFYATLTKLKGQRARFVVGTGSREVSLQEIADRWTGDYTILWRMPPSYVREIRPGDEGPMVEWLSSRLAAAQVDIPVTRVFDAALLKEVKRFQISEGLMPDGIVGPNTIIHLNTAAGADVPLLIDEEDGG